MSATRSSKPASPPTSWWTNQTTAARGATSASQGKSAIVLPRADLAELLEPSHERLTIPRRLVCPRLYPRALAGHERMLEPPCRHVLRERFLERTRITGSETRAIPSGQVGVEAALAALLGLVVGRRKSADEKARLGRRRLHVRPPSKAHAGGAPAWTLLSSRTCLRSSSSVPSPVTLAARASASPACRYQIAWSINPHMRVGAADFTRADAASTPLLLTALRATGAQLEQLAFVHGAYDSVFAKDSAVLVSSLSATGPSRRALLASPVHRRAAARAGRSRARALEALGFAVEQSAAASREGGDVVMLPGANGSVSSVTAFVPRAPRPTSSPTSSRVEVTPLELVDPHLYHLDVALSVLADGTALVCEDAFTGESLRRLRAHPSIGSIVSVPREEALRFGLNLVEADGIVVMGSRAATVEQALAARGFSVVHTPLNEFQLAGGSAACLVAPVHAPMLAGHVEPAASVAA